MKQLTFDIIGKICTKCGKWKPLNEFHKHQTSKYGYRPTCKACRSVPKTPYQLECEQFAKYDLRRCCKCGHIKSLDDFHVHGKEKRRYYECKDCMFPNREKKLERTTLSKQGKKRCAACQKIKSLSEFHYRSDREHYESICRICANKKDSEYNSKNQEKARERNRRWLAKKLVMDPDYHHKNYMQSREYYQAKKKRYYIVNKERLRAYSRQYYIEHKDEVGAYQHKYNAEHPDKIRARKIARRTKETQAGGSFTAKEWQTLCDKYGNHCLCCGSEGSLTADHIIPVSKGGTSDISNIQVLCKSCNCKKHDRIIDYRPECQ